LFLVFFGEVLSLEHGIEVLDGANPGRAVERVGGLTEAFETILVSHFHVSRMLEMSKMIFTLREARVCPGVMTSCLFRAFWEPVGLY